MSAPDLSRAIWRKSSRSNGSGGNCVEITTDNRSWAAVRDSKNPTGPALLFGAGQFAAFLQRTRTGRFNR